MPGLDQRGPMGQGPLTGHRNGRCTNYGASAKKEETVTDTDLSDNQTDSLQGRRFGFRGGMGGRGRGRGLGFKFRFRGGF